MPNELSVRQWQERYRAGAFRGKEVAVQREAGWWNWHCRDDALAGRLTRIAPVIMGLNEPAILDGFTVWFINEIGRDKLVYDSVRFEPLARPRDNAKFFKVDFCGLDEPDRWTLYTGRFSFHAPEFGCGHVHDMTRYIDNLGQELKQGIRPAFLDEKAAAVEYILRRGAILPSRALRREGEYSYSFLDRDDGRRKTVHVARSLKDVPLEAQRVGGREINGLYVYCPEDAGIPLPELAPQSEQTSKGKQVSKKGKEAER